MSKLHFNPKTLRYEVIHNRKKWIRNALYILVSGMAFAAFFIFLIINFYNSESERKKSRELEVYEETYEKLEKQYRESVDQLKKLEKQDKDLFKQIFETQPLDTTLLSDQLLTDQNHDALDMQQVIRSSSVSLQLFESKAGIWNNYIDFLQWYFFNRLDQKSLPLVIPLPEKSYTLVSGFGERIHPIFKTKRQHNGLDFAARAGTPVYAAGDGVVLENGKMELTGYGTVVRIQHRSNIVSLYAQLLESKVTPGQRVKRGELIGYVGSSGIAIGPHLHYEIWVDHKPVDPMRFLVGVSPGEYYQLQRVASMFNQSMS